MNEELTAQGHTGTVTFDGVSVVITHNWRGRAAAGKEAKVVPLGQIQQVDLLPVSEKSNGHIRFAVPGQTHPDPSLDPRSVWFTKKQSDAFYALAGELRARIESRSPQQVEALVHAPVPSSREQVDPVLRVETAAYGEHQVAGGHYRTNGLAIPKPVQGAKATFEHGADRSRPTLTRIGAGAIVAGPAGAIVGGLFKKNTSKCYVTVEFPDGEAVIVEGPVKDEAAMRKFAADVNRIAASS